MRAVPVGGRDRVDLLARATRTGIVDEQVDAVRGFSDAIAERIATLGGSPVGTPGALVEQRSWDEYSIGRATTQEHLGALDVVYQGVISSYRSAIEELDDLDLGLGLAVAVVAILLLSSTPPASTPC